MTSQIDFRIDVLILRGEVLKSFTELEEALSFAIPLSRIPGNCIGLAFYCGGKLVDFMAWGVSQ